MFVGVTVGKTDYTINYLSMISYPVDGLLDSDILYPFNHWCGII